MPPLQSATQALLALASLAPAALNASDDWTLSTTEFNRTAWQTQAYVANGYIGQRIPAEGAGYRAVTPINASADDGTNGWPLFDPRFTAAMVAGFYSHVNETAGVNFPEIPGGEQPISTLPTWSSLYLTVNNQTYDISTPDSQLSNWSQSMSIQDGIVRTSLDWTPQGMNTTVALQYTLFAHREWANVGVVRLDVEGLTEAMQVAVTDVLDGVGAWRTDFVASGILTNSSDTIYTAVRPTGINNVTAYETSILDLSTSFTNDNGSSCYTGLSTNDSTVSQCYRLSSIPSSGNITAIKYVGIASSDAFPGTEFQTALQAAKQANATGYEGVLNSHQQAWNAIWEDADIVVPGDEQQELQLATRASLFHLLSNVRNGNEPTGLGDNSIAPAGLTSDSYAGQVFWDADTWMFPSLLALFPQYAESIVDFRYRQLGAAMENAQIYNLSGALYPWTAGRFGNCTGVGPCYDYEYHLNSDIGLAIYQYYASTQNQTWLEEKGWPVLEAVSNMFASFVQYDNSTGLYSTFNETSPDEYSNHKNNSAMINGAIAVTLRNAQALASILGKQTPSNWSDIAANVTILADPTTNILLEFEGFNGTTAVKQADVVLLTYPYQYPQPATQGLLDLDFYSIATSPNGPGMTYSVFSIDAAELSPVGCADYTYMLASSQPYARAPYYQFSEQTTDLYASNGGTNPAFTFLTGHGGFLQTLTHGYTGYRSNPSRLYLDPLLPPQLTNYTLKGFKWGQSAFDIQLTTETTTITRRTGGNGTVVVEIATANAKGGNYTLNVGDSLTVPTSSTNSTLIAGNLAQCKPVLSHNDTSFSASASSNSSIVPGQFALAAVDGANATAWQPASTQPATMTVDLESPQTISALHLNFGSQPPTSYLVSAGASLANMTTIANGTVSISAPYNAQQANLVAIRVGNVTDVTLAMPVVARYVNLTIAGTMAQGGGGGDGYGGTVAEFAVL
ncbi:hypothetical protein JCM5296_003292 [Sporobolomyces johnsonii]